MKKNILVLLLMASTLTVNAYAENNMAEEEAVKNECKEESRQAESPEIYYEECVADRLQALRDSQQGSGDAAPEKG